MISGLVLISLLSQEGSLRWESKEKLTDRKSRDKTEKGLTNEKPSETELANHKQGEKDLTNQKPTDKGLSNQKPTDKGLSNQKPATEKELTNEKPAGRGLTNQKPPQRKSSRESAKVRISLKRSSEEKKVCCKIAGTNLYNMLQMLGYSRVSS